MDYNQLNSTAKILFNHVSHEAIDFAATHSDTIMAVSSVALPILAAGITLYVSYRILKHYNITPYTTYQAITGLYARCFGPGQDNQTWNPEKQGTVALPVYKSPLKFYKGDNPDVIKLNIVNDDKVERYILNIPAMLEYIQDVKGRDYLHGLHRSFLQKPMPYDITISNQLLKIVREYIRLLKNNTPQSIEAPEETSHSQIDNQSIEVEPYTDVLNETMKRCIEEYERGEQERTDYLQIAENRWKENATPKAKKTLRGWAPFNPIVGRNEFDHKNAEILNQILRYLIVCYSDESSWDDFDPKTLLKESLDRVAEYGFLGPIFDILQGEVKYSNHNETAKTELFKTISELATNQEYKDQLKLAKSLKPSEVKEEAPLVYFAHAMARAMYLNVDINEFQTRWVRKLIQKSGIEFKAPVRDMSKWTNSLRSSVDKGSKKGRSVSDSLYITMECLKGSAPWIGSLVSWMSGTDQQFHPIDTNNCIQRLSTERHGDKEIACLGLPVPTIDSEDGKSASVVGHLRLLLDYFKSTNQVFMSFMHLKISTSKSGEIDWTTTEGMRAHALQKLAEEYPGTYFYFSLPFDGALFAHPEKISDIAYDRDTHYFSLEKDIYGFHAKRSLRQTLKDAVVHNKYGWYFPKRFWDMHGKSLREKYDLPESKTPAEGLVDHLFDEIKEHFFHGRSVISSEEWQVFHVLFGARIIECFSPLSNAFHNTCKDAIDRAAVYLLARRVLNLFRHGRETDHKVIKEEMKAIFVDYVKRAVSAKQQGPIEHRHDVGVKLLEIVEKAGLIPPGTLYEVIRDHQSTLYGKKEADDGCHILEAGEGEITEWPERPKSFVGSLLSYVGF